MLLRRASQLIVFLALASCAKPAEVASASTPTGPFTSSRSHYVALRLVPGQDLKQALLDVVKAEGLEAAAVVSCVGSLSSVTLRFADQKEPTALVGPFEIVSLGGTLGPDGAHLHLSVSDAHGQTFGGHLVDGSSVYTTAEIVLIELDDLRFRRLEDPVTTWKELAIEPRP